MDSKDFKGPVTDSVTPVIYAKSVITGSAKEKSKFGGGSQMDIHDNYLDENKKVKSSEPMRFVLQTW